MNLTAPQKLVILVIAWLLLSGGAGGASGPRTIFVVRESGGDVSTEVQALAVALRDGPTSAALAAKGHKLLILDNDDAAIAKFKPFDDSKAELLICDGDKVLVREPLPLTVDTFTTVLKAKGVL